MSEMNSFLGEFLKMRKSINNYVVSPAPQDKKTKTRNAPKEATMPIDAGINFILENKPDSKVLKEYFIGRIAELSAKKI